MTCLFCDNPTVKKYENTCSLDHYCIARRLEVRHKKIISLSFPKGLYDRMIAKGGYKSVINNILKKIK